MKFLVEWQDSDAETYYTEFESVEEAQKDVERRLKEGERHVRLWSLVGECAVRWVSVVK